MGLVGTFHCRPALSLALEASAPRPWCLGTAAGGSPGLTTKVTASV